MVDTTCDRVERAASEGTLVSDGTLNDGEEVMGGATDGVRAGVGVVLGGASEEEAEMVVGGAMDEEEIELGVSVGGV